MSRATDLCTCGHDRRVYHAFGQCFHVKEGKYCTCREFMPHPQPPTVPPPDVGEKIKSHLSTLGEVRQLGTEGVFTVTTSEGEVWEVGVTLRRSRQTTTPQQILQSPEGV